MLFITLLLKQGNFTWQNGIKLRFFTHWLFENIKEYYNGILQWKIFWKKEELKFKKNEDENFRFFSCKIATDCKYLALKK